MYFDHRTHGFTCSSFENVFEAKDKLMEKI